MFSWKSVREIVLFPQLYHWEYFINKHSDCIINTTLILITIYEDHTSLLAQSLSLKILVHQICATNCVLFNIQRGEGCTIFYTGFYYWGDYLCIKGLGGITSTIGKLDIVPPHT